MPEIVPTVFPFRKDKDLAGTKESNIKYLYYIASSVYFGKAILIWIKLCLARLYNFIAFWGLGAFWDLVQSYCYYLILFNKSQ